MLTSGAPVYKRTPSPPVSSPLAPALHIHTAPSLPPIVTPLCDPGFKPELSSFMSEGPDPGDGTHGSPIALDEEGWSGRSKQELLSPGDVSGRMGSPGATGGTKRPRTETNGAGGSGNITPNGTSGEARQKRRKPGDPVSPIDAWTPSESLTCVQEPFSADMEKAFAGLLEDVKACECHLCQGGQILIVCRLLGEQGQVSAQPQATAGRRRDRSTPTRRVQRKLFQSFAQDIPI
jgi:hypothetical protein